MDHPPIRTLAADLRDVERYVALRAALARVPRHLLWKLVDRFQRFASETQPNDEYVRWADIAALLGESEPPR